MMYEHAALGGELFFSSSGGFGGTVDQVTVVADIEDTPYLYAFDLKNGEQNYSANKSLTFT